MTRATSLTGGVLPRPLPYTAISRATSRSSAEASSSRISTPTRIVTASYAKNRRSATASKGTSRWIVSLPGSRCGRARTPPRHERSAGVWDPAAGWPGAPGRPEAATKGKSRIRRTLPRPANRTGSRAFAARQFSFGCTTKVSGPVRAPARTSMASTAVVYRKSVAASGKMSGCAVPVWRGCAWTA